MDKCRVAEWVLDRVTNPQRAAAIVGDLLEERGERNAVAFWLRVARIVLAFGWRTICAPLAALFSFVLPFVAFSLYTVPHFHLQAGHSPSEGWMGWAARFVSISICLWSVTILSTVLYGLREPMTRVSFALAVLTLASSCLAWLPFAGYFVVGALGMTICAMVAYRPARRPFFCVGCAAGGFVLMFSLLGWSTMYLSVVARSPYRWVLPLAMWCGGLVSRCGCCDARECSWYHKAVDVQQRQSDKRRR